MSPNFDTYSLSIKKCSVSLRVSGPERLIRIWNEAIVNGALTNSKRARDPMTYFMLLRSLFRSISGGSFEKLYQEFLPLLPRLLRQMNQLQTALHRPEIHDLFVELSLTVPGKVNNKSRMNWNHTINKKYFFIGLLGNFQPIRLSLLVIFDLQKCVFLSCSRWWMNWWSP